MKNPFGWQCWLKSFGALKFHSDRPIEVGCMAKEHIRQVKDTIASWDIELEGLN
ncbi:hypothetical protein [Ileibacterium valens]|uniref:hypothetical protein n=1 Tax=Ileibacterium valens TaxID=1862668 RepID=UPI0015BA3F84|nr:hypothetical protein [Ileibacterium valens]